jgi:hypothetical protein
MARHPAAVVALGHKGLPGGEEQTDDAGQEGDDSEHVHQTRLASATRAAPPTTLAAAITRRMC